MTSFGGGDFRAFRLGIDPPRGDFGPFQSVSSVIGADKGIQEVFHAMEYLPHARSTHQRSPDEAVHEIQIVQVSYFPDSPDLRARF
jgi:hypothetical protein